MSRAEALSPQQDGRRQGRKMDEDVNQCSLLPVNDASPSRRINEEDSLPKKENVDDGEEEGDEEMSTSCLICLGPIQDRAVLPDCLHSEFCFECIIKWAGMHRRCPLCSKVIERYIIHSIRSDEDYLRHFLSTTSSSEKASGPGNIDDPLRILAAGARRQLARRHSRPNQSATRKRRVGAEDVDQGDREERDPMTRWDRQLEKRTLIYRHGLYALHIGSNQRSKLRPPPSSQEVATSSQLQSSLRHFLRREFLAISSIWSTNSVKMMERDRASNRKKYELDVDFLTTYSLSLLSHLDPQSNEAIQLFRELLWNDFHLAQHFVHELVTFLRFCMGQGRAGGRRIWEFDRDVARYDCESLHQKGKPKKRRELEGNADVSNVDRWNVNRKRRGGSNGSDEVTRVGKEEIIEASNGDSTLPSQQDKQAAPREEVLARRSKLLNRLEEERKRHLQSQPAPSLPVSEGDRQEEEEEEEEEESVLEDSGLTLHQSNGKGKEKEGSMVTADLKSKVFDRLLTEKDKLSQKEIESESPLEEREQRLRDLLLRKRAAAAV